MALSSITAWFLHSLRDPSSLGYEIAWTILVGSMVALLWVIMSFSDDVRSTLFLHIDAPSSDDGPRPAHMRSAPTAA